MKSVAGVFRSRVNAERAAAAVHSGGIRLDRLNLLTPESGTRQVQRVPVTDAEQPGMGTALGAVVGGTMGIAGGLWVGELLPTLLVPGVGPIAAIGAIGAAILGALGAVAGGEVGGALDEKLSEGIPGDELFVYEDALRQGRSVVIALAEDDVQAEVARAALIAAGAETIDKARHMWWIGVREAEKAKYDADGGSFEKDEEFYRRGFEAALNIDLRNKTYEEAEDRLRWLYPDSFNHVAFRRGYDSGRNYAKVTKDSVLSSRRARI